MDHFVFLVLGLYRTVDFLKTLLVSSWFELWLLRHRYFRSLVGLFLLLDWAFSLICGLCLNFFLPRFGSLISDLSRFVEFQVSLVEHWLVFVCRKLALFLNLFRGIFSTHFCIPWSHCRAWSSISAGNKLWSCFARWPCVATVSVVLHCPFFFAIMPQGLLTAKISHVF